MVPPLSYILTAGEVRAQACSPMNHVSKNLMCICMRAGAQLWVEPDRVTNLQPLLQQSTGHIFVGFENQTINTADIVGGFSRLKDVYGERRKHIKACQVCLGERRKGLMEVAGKKVYGRCDRNVPIITQVAEGEQRYTLCHGFYRDEFE
jgi:hypothetical protein